MNRNWVQVMQELPVSGLSRLLLQMCVVKIWDDEKNEIGFVVDSQYRPLVTGIRTKQIQQALSKYCNKTMGVWFEVRGAKGE